MALSGLESYHIQPRHLRVALSMLTLLERLITSLARKIFSTTLLMLGNSCDDDLSLLMLTAFSRLTIPCYAFIAVSATIPFSFSFSFSFS